MVSRAPNWTGVVSVDVVRYQVGLRWDYAWQKNDALEVRSEIPDCVADQPTDQEGCQCQLDRRSRRCGR